MGRQKSVSVGMELPISKYLSSLSVQVCTTNGSYKHMLLLTGYVAFWLQFVLIGPTSLDCNQPYLRFATHYASISASIVLTSELPKNIHITAVQQTTTTATYTTKYTSTKEALSHISVWS